MPAPPNVPKKSKNAPPYPAPEGYAWMMLATNPPEWKLVEVERTAPMGNGAPKNIRMWGMKQNKNRRSTRKNSRRNRSNRSNRSNRRQTRNNRK